MYNTCQDNYEAICNMILENIEKCWAHSGIMIFSGGPAQNEYLLSLSYVVLSTKD